MDILYGHLPDDNTPESWTPLSDLVGAAPTPAPIQSTGLLEWADRVEMQPGGSCVGHGIAGAIYAKQGAENAAEGERLRPRVFPAPLGIYYNGRAKGGYANVDKGSQPLLAYAGLTDYGYCAIEDWPSTDANILKQPPAEAYRLAADQRVVQYYRIVTDGEEACEDVRQGVSKQNPVTLAMNVDLAFENLTTGVWPGPTGALKGSHYVWVVEYNYEYVVICNSWSRAWGMNGFGKVSWKAIANSSVTRDRYVLTFAPAPVREAQ